MNATRLQPAGRPAAPGFALIAAIFLLVVLGALAFYLVSLSGTQQFTTLWAVQGARAHYAAQSGLQWGAWQAINGGDCNGNLSVDAGAPGRFSVAVSCSGTPQSELGEVTTVWTLTAEASYGTPANAAYVRRKLQMTVAVPAP